MSANDVNVDIILQSIGRNNTKDISFTIQRDDLKKTLKILNDYIDTIGAEKVIFDEGVSKVSIVGAGMESHPGVAAKMFEALFDAQINIQMISTSEIKISVLIDSNDSNHAVSVIHNKFFDSQD